MSELARALETPGEKSYADALRGLAPRDAEDAEAVGRALRGLTSRPQPPRRIVSDLSALTSLFQEAEDEETAEALRSHALPGLIRGLARAVLAAHGRQAPGVCPPVSLPRQR